MRERLWNRFKEMANPSKRTFRVVIASLAVLVLAWEQIEATRLGYRVEASRRTVHALQGRIGAVERQLQSDLSPAQLAVEARTRLGMQPASPECLRLLDGRPKASTSDSFLARLLARTRRSLAASAT
jgi:hypothetical protein